MPTPRTEAPRLKHRAEIARAAYERLEHRKRARERLIDYATYIWDGYEVAEHHRIIADKLEEVEAGTCRRLIILMPPRHGKSRLASQMFIAWYMGRNPDKHVIATSYAQELAEDFGREVRDQLSSTAFPHIFPDCSLRTDSQAVDDFRTTKGGRYLARGVGGGITGKGAHLFLIDDPYKNRQDADSSIIRRRIASWYTSTAYTRLEPGAAIVIILTHWREDDIAGWVQKEHAHEGWEVLNLPAILDENTEEEEALWPERFPLERLHQIKRTLGKRDWSALYQQSPEPDGGNILKAEWWKEWEEDETPPCDHVIMAVDTATTTKTSSDQSAGSIWGRFYIHDRPNVILLYAWADRLEFNELVEKIIGSAETYQPTRILVEAKNVGHAVVQELRRRTLLPVHELALPKNTKGQDLDKEARVHAISSLVEGGSVWIPKRAWAYAVVDQCAAFPAGEHDDLVDTVAMALRHLRSIGIGVRSDEPDPRAKERYRIPKVANGKGYY